ncbi:hypothetical protein [Porticoccus sp.]
MNTTLLKKAIRLYGGAGLGRELGVSRQFVSQMLKTGVVPKDRQEQLEPLVRKALKELQAKDYA